MKDKLYRNTLFKRTLLTGLFLFLGMDFLYAMQAQLGLPACKQKGAQYAGCNLVLATGGASKSITVQNNSNIIARNIAAILPASWTDVTQNASSCVSLAPGATCQLIFTPGTTAYAQQTIPVQGSNTTTVTYMMSVIQSPYTVIPSADSNGTISPNTPQTVNPGGSISFTATPNTGYAINQWLLDGIPVQTGGGTYQLNNITADHTVNVTFSNITYTITPLHGANGTISPNSAQTVNYGSSITFTAIPEATYGVDQWFLDGALVQTGGMTYLIPNVTADHTVDVTFATASFSTSVSFLSLSVNNTGLNSALTGTPRQITIENIGSITANNLSVTTPTGLPPGTTISGNTCTGNLPAGNTCVITITPGSTPTLNSNSNPCSSGTQPVANMISVSADSGLPVSVGVEVLSYGCQHQSGFLFSVDDSTPSTGSIGGKVVALVDQSNPSTQVNPQSGIPWDADPSCTAASCNDVQTNAWELSYGQNAASVPGSTNPNNSGTNGPGNTWLISDVLLNAIPTYNTNNPANYAAGKCISYTGGGFNNWYLPTICELDSFHTTAGCPIGTQDILRNIPVMVGSYYAATPSTSCNQPNGPPVGTTCIAGIYWSSTEASTVPTIGSWITLYVNSSGGFQYPAGKFSRFGARCVRGF